MVSRELDKITAQIVSTLRTHYAPERVILFGSHAHGVAQADSDLDLLIIKQTDERFIDRWVAVRRILSDPSRKFAIETLVLTPKEVSERVARGDQFVADIIENGQVLYAA
jgi:predicted nucleotidyltransferase